MDYQSLKRIFALLSIVYFMLVPAEGAFGRARYAQARQVDLLIPSDAALAVTPYPSAEELKPEVPFEDGSATDSSRTPLLSYGPPDDTTFNIPEPDSVYGPPEVIQNDLNIPNGDGLSNTDAAATLETAAQSFPPLLDDKTARFVDVRGLRTASVRVVRGPNNAATRTLKYRALKRAGRR